MYRSTSKRQSSAVDGSMNIFWKHLSHQNSPILNKRKINLPINTASAAQRQITAVVDTARLAGHYTSVLLSVLMSKRQAFDKRYECSYLDSYNWHTMPDLLKIHLQPIGAEVPGTLLKLLM